MPLQSFIFTCVPLTAPAQPIPVSYTHLHNSKEPRYITLHRIALAFGMTPAEFLNFNEMNEFSFDEIN